MVINIKITDKRPSVEGAPVIVCGNSDYTIKFTFDAEWDAYSTKVVRFVWVANGKVRFKDVEMKDTTECNAPKLHGTNSVRIGVYAGDLHTTTRAVIPCERSILCEEGKPATEDYQYYANEAKDAANEAKDAANEAKDAANEVKSAVEKGGALFSNALRGKKSGGAVAMSDISPLKHTLDVRARSKNLINIPTLYVTGDGTLKNLYEIITPIKCGGENTVLSCKAEYGNDVNVSDGGVNLVYANIRYANGAVGNIPLFKNSQGNYGENTEILTTKTNGDIVQITIFQHQRLTSGSVTVKDIQLEIGTVATEYTPCIPDISSVKVKKLGKNLINPTDYVASSTATTLNGNVFTTSFTSGTLFFNSKKQNPIKAGTYTITVTPVDCTMHFGFFCYSTTDSTFTPFIAQYKSNVSTPWSFTFTADVDFVLALGGLGSGSGGGYGEFNYTIQLAVGATSTDTEYEPYIEPVEYATNEDGTVKGVLPIYPTTTLMTDTAGAVIDVEYNKDINKAFAELYNAIISLGGNV